MPSLPRGRPGFIVVIALSIVIAVAIAVVASGALAGRQGPATPGATGDPAAGRPAQTDPTRYFLDTYVEPDGRVSRTDEGGDTVSEGQAYGLMLAVGTGDEPTFDRIWRWTRANLQRPDGLLSWTWADGAVTDETSASDADLDAAHALVAAGARFDRPDLRADGVRLGEAVLEHETAVTPLGRVLTAGSWASEEPWQVNPSYGSPLAVQYLAQVSGDPRWAEMARGNAAVLAALLEKSPLPPDWAQVTESGEVSAMPSPANASGEQDVRFGLDAARVSIRSAPACRPDERAVAAGLAPVLVRPADQVRGAYDLGGAALVSWQHPVQFVAAAAAAGAAGGSAPAAELLAAARRLDQQQPTYYGAAWVALGTVLLQQNSSLTPQDCGTPPVAPGEGGR